MRSRPSLSSVAAVVCLTLIIGRVLRGPTFPPPVSCAGDFVVQQVNDDGTLLLTTGQCVRLLGVDVRDDQLAGGDDARNALALMRRLAAGRRVTLEFDRSRIDQQYRTLAYVHVDGRLLNAELIRQGHGTVDQRFPLQSDCRDQLEEAQEQARAEGRGVWSGS